MSHFGRSGPPDISDTYSLLVLNITFRTTADDLFPLFDKYGKVVDIFIPRDRRTGESRGFAFVRYKYADEAQKAVERLDGRVVDGREITVQFAKYGPNAERIHKGRITEDFPKSKYRSRSRSPRRRYRDDYRDRDNRRRSRSRSLDRYERSRYRGRDRDYYRRSRSRSASPDYYRSKGRSRYDDERRSRSRSRSRSVDSASPARHSPGVDRSPLPRRSPSPRGESPDRRSRDGRSPSQSVSPRGRSADSRNPSPRNSDVECADCRNKLVLTNFLPNARMMLLVQLVQHNSMAEIGEWWLIPFCGMVVMDASSCAHLMACLAFLLIRCTISLLVDTLGLIIGVLRWMMKTILGSTGIYVLRDWGFELIGVLG
ncbi:hypothetical protein FNV43_RR22104 [Rhamnella rubrinervis]|uniref:RRM domain-containing protein n=1 Tax=Rhamnella rubrinervis TaxID=2594499 RepID=A0A8K0DPL2_9ROSA|nr:hypothetical protein FNV43_RR22104 [Rhamnella rubrinervis]